MAKLPVRHWHIQDDIQGLPKDYTTSADRMNHSKDLSGDIRGAAFYSRPLSIYVYGSQLKYSGIRDATYEKISAGLDQIAEKYSKEYEEMRLNQSRELAKASTGDDAAKVIADMQAKFNKQLEEKLNEPVKDPFEGKEEMETMVKPGYGIYEYTNDIFEYAIHFHIPPSSISWQYQHALNRTQTRGGWNIERSRENLVNISIQGSSGIFYHSKEGLTRLYARSTYAYRELMELVQVYRNNGMSLDPTSGVIYTIGAVVLSYDNMLYTGSFDNFELKESEENPYRFEYSLSFVSRGEHNNTPILGHVSRTDRDLKLFKHDSIILPDTPNIDPAAMARYRFRGYQISSSGNAYRLPVDNRIEGRLSGPSRAQQSAIENLVQNNPGPGWLDRPNGSNSFFEETFNTQDIGGFGAQ